MLNKFQRCDRFSVLANVYPKSQKYRGKDYKDIIYKV
jgi:hypothetical protein